MLLRRSRQSFGWVLALALGLFAFASAGARAQFGPPPPPRPTAPEIKQETLDRIDDAVVAAVARMDVLVERAVFRLDRAEERGATKEALQRTALKFKKPFGGAARRALAQINREIGTAMIRMRSAPDYDRELEADLGFRRETAVADLEAAIESAEAAIDAAIAPAGG